MTPYYKEGDVIIYLGNCLAVLRDIPDESVQCCVTSPPYWRLRDYGIDVSIWDDPGECEHEWGESGAFCRKCGAWRGCFGLEPTLKLYIEHTVQIFREVRRVLKKDGTLWLNLADSRAGGGCTRDLDGYMPAHARETVRLKPKSMLGIPWRVAFALQADSWYLRQDIIWQKKNAMPESVKDRCTKAHEYIFLLSKNAKYFYDAGAIKEGMDKRQVVGNKKIKIPSGWDTAPGAHGSFHREGRGNPAYSFNRKTATQGKPGLPDQHRPDREYKEYIGSRNKRSVWTLEDHKALLEWLLEKHPETANEYFNGEKSDVWTVSTKAFKSAHFATFPPDLIKPCIMAGSKPGDIVLDPFGGTMTTAYVAKELNRQAIMIELKEEYIDMGKNRLAQGVLQFYAQ